MIGSQQWVILPPSWYLAMSSDILGCHYWELRGILSVSSGQISEMNIEHPAVHGTAPHYIEYLAP